MTRNMFVYILLLVVGIILFCSTIGDVVENVDLNDLIPNDGVSQSDDIKAKKISEAIEPTNPAVRAYALSAIKSSNSGSYNIGQICDIYYKLYNDWVYVNDPAGVDYYAPASESVKYLRGDCDDYAILMASLIESIGGGARVVCAYNDEVGHAYAIVYLSDKQATASELVNQLSSKYNGRIHYIIHTNSDGIEEYWLNLDWTARHPGGEFFDSNGEILVVASNGYHYRSNFNP